MATAKQLPSGSWRVQVFAGVEIVNGKKKRVYKSFTGKSKHAAELAAKRYAVDKEVYRKPEKEEMLFKDAMALYIKNRTNTRSPGTINKYKSMVEGFEPLNDLPICDIDNSTLMAFVNEISKEKKQKTVLDYKNLAVSVIREIIPTAVFRVNIGLMEDKSDKEILCNMPSEVQLSALIKNAGNDELKTAIYLGAFCMMREGEIAALKKSDIDGNIITISKCMKRGLDKKWFVAGTKTKKIRKVIAPQFVIDAFMALPGDSIGLNPHAIGCRYDRLCKTLGYDALSFHGLRKFGASQWSLENINTAYIQEAGGWSSDNVMKRVYVKTFSDAQKKAFETMNDKYNAIVNG